MVLPTITRSRVLSQPPPAEPSYAQLKARSARTHDRAAYMNTVCARIDLENAEAALRKAWFWERHDALKRVARCRHELRKAQQEAGQAWQERTSAAAAVGAVC